MSSVWVLLYFYTGIIILCVVLVNECRCCVLINTPPSPTCWQQEGRMGYWVSGTWDRNCILLLYWRHMLQKVSDIFVLNTSVGYLGHLWLTLFLVQVKNTWNKHEKWGKGKRKMGKGRQREVTEEHSWQTTLAETLLIMFYLKHVYLTWSLLRTTVHVPSNCPLAASTVGALYSQVL